MDSIRVYYIAVRTLPGEYSDYMFWFSVNALLTLLTDVMVSEWFAKQPSGTFRVVARDQTEPVNHYWAPHLPHSRKWP